MGFTFVIVLRRRLGLGLRDLRQNSYCLPFLPQFFSRTKLSSSREKKEKIIMNAAAQRVVQLFSVFPLFSIIYVDF
jgi:hypothetical protein